jgi:hypothetical protein
VVVLVVMVVVMAVVGDARIDSLVGVVFGVWCLKCDWLMACAEQHGWLKCGASE